MSDELTEVIRHLSSPLAPIPSGVAPRVRHLPGIRAALFDIYGTLMISGSGEVGTADGCHVLTTIRSTLKELGIDARRLTDEAGPEAAITSHHQQARTAGIDYPEVNIRDVWRQSLEQWVRRGQLPPPALAIDVSRFAIEYECRVNPVWPMPGWDAALDALRNRLVLGVVSNAQFFTPLLFPALLGRSLEELGFSSEMQYFSYQYGCAKPSPRLFAHALEALWRRGIRPDQTVYIGNDMLNDISVPAAMGIRTILFAGDLRSLRWRNDDPRVGTFAPDAIVTHLTQLPDCLI